MSKITCETWLKRIKDSERARDQEKNDKGWDRFLEEYQGKYNLGTIDKPVPPINMVYGHVHTMIPKLYFRDPYIAINPKGFQYIKRSKILEAVVNYLVVELNLKKEITKILMDTILVGHGWFKYGYAGAFGKIDTADDRKGKKGKKDAPVEDINEYVKNEEIFVVHVPWEDVVFDRMAKDPPYDCRWIAHAYIKPLEAVKASDLYDNAAGLKANVVLKDNKYATSVNANDSDVPLVKLWEIWDKDSAKVYIVAEGHDEYLQEKDNVYEMRGLPFSMLKFNPVPGKPYPLSDIYIIEPQILERIKLRATQLNHIKRWNRQMSIEKGSHELAELQKMELGIDGSVIQRNPGSQAPVPIQYAPMQAEVFALDNLIAQDLDASIGQTDIERGGRARTNTRTLGELETQLAGTQSRSQKRQDMLEDFLEEVIIKIIELLKQFQDVPRYVRITGKSPEEIGSEMQGTNFDGVGLSFTKDDIQGDYDVEVKAGSTIPLNKENRLKVMEEIIKLGEFIGITPGGPVSRAIGKEILHELEIKQIEKAYEEEEQHMMEMQKAQAAQQQHQIGQDRLASTRDNLLAVAKSNESISNIRNNALPQPNNGY